MAIATAPHVPTGVPDAVRSCMYTTSLDTGGLSATRMQRLHAVLQQHLAAGQTAGALTLISRRGREHADALGTLAFDSSALVKRDTIFRLASMTKPVTAVAAMILVEECRLRLDDSIERWLPELANRRVLRTPASTLDDTVPARRPITVRDLLTFRSGYGEPAFLAGLCPMQKALAEARLPLAEWIFNGSSDEFMRRLGALPLVAQPGERWLYHMSGEILGVLISRVAEKPLATFMRERIFEPLGMRDTGFHVAARNLERFATCYCTLPTRERAVYDAPSGRFARPPAFESGAGGLVSTADDMLAFGKMLLDNGSYRGERILSRASVELMTRDQLTAQHKAASPFFPGFWDTFGWGMGLGVVTEPRYVGLHPGCFGWGACTTSMWIDPHEDLIGILMTQHLPSWMDMKAPDIIGDFWTSVYQAIDD